MPRITRETLEGYAVRSRKLDVPQIDPRDGQPLHDGRGQPKTLSLTVLGFIDPENGHLVEVPLDDAGRAAVIEALTGGIVVPDLAVGR